MAAGLRERERLRDLFGRHVGDDVAGAALADGVALGGEERDGRGAVRRRHRLDVAGCDAGPEEMVGLLNRFFEIVVDAVEADGGLVNKFEGDAALCVFGAPTDHADPAGAALRAAARAICDAVAATPARSTSAIGVLGRRGGGRQRRRGQPAASTP